MIPFKRLQLVKNMIMQLVGYSISLKIAIDLSKPQALGADYCSNTENHFTGNTTMLFIIEEAKETFLDF